MGNVRFWGNRVLFTENNKVAMHEDCCCLPPYYKFVWTDQVCYQEASYNDAYTLIKKWDSGQPVDLDKEIWIEPSSQKSTLPGRSGKPLTHTIHILEPVDLYYHFSHWGGALQSIYFWVHHNGVCIDEINAASYSSDYIEGHFACAVGDEVLFSIGPSYDPDTGDNSENIVSNEEYWDCLVCTPCEEGTPGAIWYEPNPIMMPGYGYWAICENHTMAPKYLTHG